MKTERFYSKHSIFLYTESVILSAEEKEYLFLIRRAFESANPGKRLLAVRSGEQVFACPSG